MARHSRFVLLSGMLLFVLLVSLTQPMGVSAQDETPPPATEEPVQPPDEEADSLSPIATEAPFVEEPSGVVTEVPLAPEESMDADGVSLIAEGETEGAGEEVTVAEVLEAAPEGTEVVVLDENEEPLPLVSEDAAEIVAGSDPMWCPAGQVPGDPDCTASYGTVTLLIANLGGKTGAGTIYFTPTYSTNDATFDHGNVNLAGLTDLTIQGGWNGSLSGAGYALSGVTTFSVPLTVINWSGNVTINDITITGAAGTGLTVYTQGDITLDHVVANGNSGDGADLDNCIDAGFGCTGTGDVSVINSQFDGNNQSLDPADVGAGLYIDSTGNVTLDHVSASNNGRTPGSAGGDGAQIGSFSSLTIQDSIFNNNYSPVEDYGWGLFANGDGDVTLTNVTASRNDNGNPGMLAGGAHINAAGNVTIDPGEFNGNLDGPGLDVMASGDVTLAEVTASRNGFGGAVIENFFGSGNISISYSNFDGNAGLFGLEVVALSPLAEGTVRLDHVSSSNNVNGFGLIFLNPALGSPASILIQDSTLDANGLNGAFLETSGNATLICSQFNDNGSGGAAGLGFGVDGFQVDGTFTLDDVTFSGNADGDYQGTPVFMSGGCTIVRGKGHTSTTALPLHIVPVAGGEQIELDCGSYSGTKLVLPNTDSVILPCPIKDQGMLTGKGQEQLPAPLNAGFGFASGLDVQVLRDGESVDETKVRMTIDFLIPADMQGANLAILRWDEEKLQWVEVPGVKTGDDRFLANSSLTGVYVLVTK